ncbi:ABC transporter substrate-binding protein [Roseateles sp.]|uniref:substrate-binding periplasmic protein n=1 Tax=Roseateles sp. TaxID=1971397 RepID=UPI0025D666BC|nr:transporter substrate-binding domain-containing protein [Roseateles sp.]MBV8034195.1 transporter substrate-binding domain-containing protein [Roseateles sp.]
MHSIRRRLLPGAALALAGPLRAAGAEPLQVLVDGSTELPQALVRGDTVVDGLQHNLAVEIGRRVGRSVQFRLLPRRRIAAALLDGEADMICGYQPAWLSGPLRWSHPFLDDGDLLVTAARHGAPTRLRDVAGQRIGTIAGFVYPELEQRLGSGFVRDDAPNLSSNLRKLANRRVDHAVIGRTNFEYLLRRGELPVEVHAPLPIAQWRNGCALSPRTPLSLAALNAAIMAMQADGSLKRIRDRYR